MALRREDRSGDLAAGSPTHEQLDVTEKIRAYFEDVRREKLEKVTLLLRVMDRTDVGHGWDK